MVVVKPKRTRYRLEEELGRPPDVRVFIVQHELYANGKDFADGRALYVMFNGYNFRHVTQPVQARPGDYVRFYYLNVGPNLVGSFHAVGGIWEYAYPGGNPANVWRGLQTTVAAPTDSWVIEWRVPAEGSYLLVTHAFGTQTMKGAGGACWWQSRAARGRRWCDPRVPTCRSREGPSAWWIPSAWAPRTWMFPSVCSRVIGPSSAWSGTASGPRSSRCRQAPGLPG